MGDLRTLSPGLFSPVPGFGRIDRPPQGPTGTPIERRLDIDPIFLSRGSSLALREIVAIAGAFEESERL